ncbi:MAG TPA: PfkB family carbohydrate kinase [Prolixibacteraceae bacterium]|nr:PfkB family carbohydrate kinase [Prolixibacteraceae bacterium]
MGKKIVAFGELVWDIFPDGKKIGGAPSNLVYRVNALGDLGYLLSRVGEDKLGEEALKMLAQMHIADDNVQIDPVFPTGTVAVKIGSDGRPDYTIHTDVAFDHIEFTAEALKLVREADCLCYGTLVQRYGISKNTLRELLNEAPEPLKFLDLKLRKNCYNRAIIESSLRSANILRVKENELYTLKNELDLFEFESKGISAELINEYNLDIVLVTRGKDGAFALDKEGNYFEDRGYEIKFVDTVGSGVAFSAGFLHYFLAGEGVEAALQFANAAGALTAATAGATTPVSKRQILELMKKGKRR